MLCSAEEQDSYNRVNNRTYDHDTSYKDRYTNVKSHDHRRNADSLPDMVHPPPDPVDPLPLTLDTDPVPAELLPLPSRRPTRPRLPRTLRLLPLPRPPSKPQVFRFLMTFNRI